MNQETSRWLGQAIQDLETPEILFDAQRYGPSAFYCQQSAEKAIKAILYNFDERPWGHSLPSLLDQTCVALRIGPQDAPVSEVEALDEHYIRPRYPDARPSTESAYDKGTAQEAIWQANAVLDFVQRHLDNA